MRLHTEKIRPPRALWVPFELGRPLGIPNEPAFQTRVLRAALDLLERTDGPVLEDFPEDAPESVSDDGEGWVCPINLPAPDVDQNEDAALLNEIEAMRSWYDLAVERRGRTTVGLSGLQIETVARYLSAWSRGETPDRPADSIEDADMPNLIRLACEDLKAFYAEAATAQPGRGGSTPSSGDIAEWFWSQTEAGNMLLILKQALSQNENKMLAVVGQMLVVPYTQAERQPR
ncbi:MAG: hypothetical protein ACE363_03740 [Alphaproteobacteria bacterium]